MYDKETIVAVSTPPGRGGIGIVRLSGSEARRIAEPMLRLRQPLSHAQARLGDILDRDTKEKLDEAVVTYFVAPHSYTGEDVVEIAAHGSPVILEALVGHALSAGARLAEPGEFTQRAFLSGRIDLTQAEAVRDLIEAQTLYQARVAAQQLEGALSRRIRPIKRQLVDLVALLEAGIDFAEDDIEVTPKEEILSRLAAVQGALGQVAASFRHGRIVHSGLTLAIVGRVNAGKSSLFNCLVERERAIVTAAPGTTRDLVTERVSLGGIPVELVDTAGLREAPDAAERGSGRVAQAGIEDGLDAEILDEAEQIGIARSREAMAGADIVLLVLDATRAPGPKEKEVLSALEGRRAIVVVNKIDLLQTAAGVCAGSPSTIPAGTVSEAELATEPGIELGLEFGAANGVALGGLPLVRTSALAREGVDELRARMLAMVHGSHGETESGMLTNLRQSEAVTAALQSLAAGQRSAEQEIPHEMVLLDLYEALRRLDLLTGETTADDILNQIFSTFCIGK
jgi:tRNA modification GTPase